MTYSKLNKVFLTNNICQSIIGKISNYISEGRITKTTFRDCINFILNEYLYKHQDYILTVYTEMHIFGLPHL